MIQCPKCGKSMSEYAVECPHCKGVTETASIQKSITESMNKKRLAQVSIQKQYIFSAIFALLSVLVLKIPGIFEVIVCGQFIGNSGLHILSFVDYSYNLLVLMIIAVVTMAVANTLFTFLLKMMGSVEIVALVQLAVSTVLNFILVSLFSVNPEEAGVPEDIMSWTLEVDQYYPWYFAVIVSVFTVSSLYVMRKWGIKRSLLLAGVMSIVTLVALVIRCVLFTTVFSMGVRGFYWILPIAFVVFFMIAVDIVMLVIYSKK